MDKKTVFEEIYKNRFLIISCAVLIMGTFFGTSMLGFIPEEIRANLFDFISGDSREFGSVFINRFTFPFFVLLCLFLSGTSIFGEILSIITIFINGLLFGFEKALYYNYCEADYIPEAIIIFFTSTLFFEFILITASENSFFSSKKIIRAIENKNAEKPHSLARNSVVKLIAFTVVFAVISAFSAYISVILQKFL